jgi:hypothetical protein
MTWGRLRWRLRGAWLWPTFALATFVDAWLLHVRPVQGLGIDVISALLIAGFVNLGAVALAMPVGGLLVRRSRPDLPKVVASDYAGVVALGVTTTFFLVAGLVHHRAVAAEARAADRALVLVREEVGHAAPAVVKRNVTQADTIRVDPEKVYRSCIPTTDPQRPWCLVVHLDTRPARVVFSGREPNSMWTAR